MSRVLAKPVRTLLRARAWGERVQRVAAAVELRDVVVVRFTAAARALGSGSVVFISGWFCFFFLSCNECDNAMIKVY